MDEAERIAVLEAEIRHINKNLDAMSRQVGEMHELLLQARGAKWAILGIASLAGFLSAKMAGIAAAFGFKFP